MELKNNGGPIFYFFYFVYSVQGVRGRGRGRGVCVGGVAVLCCVVCSGV